MTKDNRSFSLYSSNCYWSASGIAGSGNFCCTDCSGITATEEM